MSMLAAVSLLAPGLAGCSPELVIGTGELAFEPLDPVDPTLELVYGPQGGWHVVLAFEARRMSGSGIYTVDGLGTIDDQRVAAIDGAWITFSRVDNRLQAWNTFLIFEVPDPTPLHQAWLDIQIQLTGPGGRTVSAEAGATIVDLTRGD